MELNNLYQCNTCSCLFENINLFLEHICDRNNNSEINEKDTSKKVEWSNAMTKALIGLYRENKDKFDNPEFTKKRVFEIIAEGMQLFGYPNITGPMCQLKWKSLLRTYKGIVDRKKQSGEGASYTFAHYEELDELLGKNANIRPPVIYRSSDGGPTYREDILESLPSTSSSSAAPSSSSASPNPPSNNPPPLANETPVRNRRDLPYWCKDYFKRLDRIEEERNELRSSRREQEAERRAEERRQRAEERQRRHEERQRRHQERNDAHRELIELLKSISKNN